MTNDIPTCTIAAFPLTLLGVTGFVTSVFALVLMLMPSKHARIAATVALVVGVFTLSFGNLAKTRMNAAVDAARAAYDFGMTHPAWIDPVDGRVTDEYVEALVPHIDLGPFLSQ